MTDAAFPDLDVACTALSRPNPARTDQPRPSQAPTTLARPAFARLAALSTSVAALTLSGCGGGGGGAAAPPPFTAPPPPAANTGPITAPAGAWSFVRVAGSRCANGSETGIAVHPVSGSRELLLFVDGGGACSTGPGCWGVNPGASNLNGYAEAEFANESKLRNDLYLSNEAGNPFAGMNRVMLPYCTGDAHTGTTVQNFNVNGSTRSTSFVGATNVERMLDRLAATWPQLDRAWVIGTSAGGGGATYHYAKLRSRLATQVNLIVDSAPGYEDADDITRWTVWGVVPVCTSCTTVERTRVYNRTLDPSSRYAFLSFRYDAATANGRSLTEVDRDLGALVARIQTEANSRVFIADNSATGLGPPTRHVVTTQTGLPALQQAHAGFIGAMVSGNGWTDRRITVP